MKSLFSEKESYTVEANGIVSDTLPIFIKIFEEQYKKEFSVREVAHILHSVITQAEVMTLTKNRRNGRG